MISTSLGWGRHCLRSPSPRLNVSLHRNPGRLSSYIFFKYITKDVRANYRLPFKPAQIFPLRRHRVRVGEGRVFIYPGVLTLWASLIVPCTLRTAAADADTAFL